MSEKKYCKICQTSEISMDIDPAEVETGVCSLCQRDVDLAAANKEIAGLKAESQKNNFLLLRAKNAEHEAQEQCNNAIRFNRENIQLKAENDRLRVALEKIDKLTWMGCPECNCDISDHDVFEVAKQALTPTYLDKD